MPTMPPPGMPSYPMGAPMWDAERTKQVNRTKTGLLLLLIGGLIGWVPVIGLLGGLLAFIGAIFVILGRKAFGPAHSRNVVLAIVLFFVGIIAAIAIGIASFAALFTLGPDPTEQEVVAAMGAVFQSILIGILVGAAIGGLASVLFVYALQEKTGKMLLWGGYAASLVVAIITVVVLNSLVQAAIDAATGGATYDPAPLLALQDQVGVYGLLEAIPSLLFAAATYLAWNRINKGEIPAPPMAPGMPPAIQPR